MFARTVFFCCLRNRVSSTALLFVMAATACVNTPRAVVPMWIQRTPGTPRDADVVVDEDYVGPLYLVATQGPRLPVGRHRVTITSEGYFPWDRLVEADRTPIQLSVNLVPVPE